MKKYLLFLSTLCILTHISNAQIKKAIPINPTLVKTPGPVKTPQNLVYIVMSDGEGYGERKAAGQLTKHTANELGMIDFFKWRPWVFKKDAQGVFSYTGPKDERGELVGARHAGGEVLGSRGPAHLPSGEREGLAVRLERVRVREPGVEQLALIGGAGRAERSEASRMWSLTAPCGRSSPCRRCRAGRGGPGPGRLACAGPA